MLDIEDCVSRDPYSFALDLYLKTLALLQTIRKSSQFGNHLLVGVSLFDVSFGFFLGHGFTSS